MTTIDKKVYGLGIGLAMLYGVWLTTGWWKLGFGVINGIYLGFVAYYFRKQVKRDWFWWLVWTSSLVLGLFLALRSAWFTTGLNIIFVILANVLLAALAKEKEGELTFERSWRTLWGFAGRWMKALVEAVTYLGSVAPKRMSNWQKIVIGILIAIPFLALFGTLFYSADPIFAHFVRAIKWPDWNISKIINWKSITTILFFGAVVGAIQNQLAEKRSKPHEWKFVSELNIAALILQGLFAVFTLFQLRYFGVGAATLREMGITFSNYTRQGYTQMIIASLLAWGMVYGLDYLNKNQKLTRNLCLIFLGEILVFVAGATKRNWLYQSAYGFTEIRLLGFWLSAWLVGIVGLTLFKIIKERSLNFLTRGVIVISLVTLVGLNWFNIDRMIATVKPAKLAQGVDYSYLTRLSNDSWPIWEETLVDVEKRIQENTITSSSEVVRIRMMVSGILSREVGLERQKQNGWHYLGAWNAADAKAAEFISNNSLRMRAIYDKLTELDKKINENQQTEIKTKADTYRGEIRRILLGYKMVGIDDTESWKPYQGEMNFMRLSFNGIPRDEMMAEMDNKIQKATQQNCRLDSRRIVVNGEMRVNHIVSCRL